MKTRPIGGFTLIELLVVIAIIAVLAAIVLPVFARVRENARKVHCLSGERQLLMAAKMYSDDNDRTLVPARAGTAPAPSLGYTWCYLLQPYMKSDKLLICPSDPSPQTAKSSTDLKHSYGINYLLTFNRGYGTTYPFTVKMGSIERTSDLILFFEMTGDAQDMGMSVTATRYSRIASRHNGLSDYGFLDGHAKALRLDEVEQNRLWDPFAS